MAPPLTSAGARICPPRVSTAKLGLMRQRNRAQPNPRLTHPRPMHPGMPQPVRPFHLRDRTAGRPVRPGYPNPATPSIVKSQ